MATFIIVPTVGDTGIDSIIPSKYGNKAMKLPRGEWLVSYDGTSKQLSDDLGITAEGQTSSAIVFNFSAYWGRASKDIWEWIQENGDD